MKTLSILLLAALSLSLTACAVDEAPRSGTPGRSSHKPLLDGVVVNNDRGNTDEPDVDTEDLALDPRIADLVHDKRDGLDEWAEEIVINGELRTVLHRGDGSRELLD